MIRSIPESYWGRVIQHPESGEMTMDRWLQIYEGHIPLHIGQMQRNYDAWLAHQK
jgi:hypothetical protein